MAKKKSRSFREFIKERDELLNKGRKKPAKKGPGGLIGTGAAAGAKQRKPKKKK